MISISALPEQGSKKCSTSTFNILFHIFAAMLKPNRNLVVGLDGKIDDIDRRMTKLEEDDMSTVGFRSVNETVISKDNSSSKEEKLSLLAEGFVLVLPERSGKYRYDKGVDKLVDQNSKRSEYE